MAARDVQLARLTGGWLHLAHVSTLGTVEILRRARSQGIAVTAEVTPHHLTLTDEWVLGRHGVNGRGATVPLSAYDTRCKVNPPLRAGRDTAALVQALADGEIDAIATDHAPHASNDKDCTFDEAAFGISGLETAFGLLMRLVHEGKVSLNTLIEKLTIGPAKVLGKHGAGLGTLRPGSQADIAILDPDAEWTVDSSRFASKGRNTPVDGIALKGAVAATLAGGKIVHQAHGLKITGGAQQRSE